MHVSCSLFDLVGNFADLFGLAGIYAVDHPGPQRGISAGIRCADVNPIADDLDLFWRKFGLVMGAVQQLHQRTSTVAHATDFGIAEPVPGLPVFGPMAVLSKNNPYYKTVQDEAYALPAAANEYASSLNVGP